MYIYIYTRVFTCFVDQLKQYHVTLGHFMLNCIISNHIYLISY